MPHVDVIIMHTNILFDSHPRNETIWVYLNDTVLVVPNAFDDLAPDRLQF
jgi:hypothetical protein